MRGAFAGAVAGLVAAWAMESFQAAWSGAKERLQGERPERSSSGEPATVRVAERVAEPVLERELTEAERPVAGEMVHYAFGGLNGALYGALADMVAIVRAGNGMFFGAVLWLAVDELGLWKMGLAKKPAEYPVGTHAYALASHLVYGFTLETVRRAIRWMVL